MIKKIIFPFLIVALIFSMSSPASAGKVFSDVGDQYAAKAELEFLAEQGIVTSGPSVAYGINRSITRLEASEMLVRALKLDITNRPDPSVVDVKKGSPGYEFIATVVDEKIMVGNLKGQFNPDSLLTRAEMAAILVRAFDLQQPNGYKKFQFVDVNVKSFAAPSIAILFANNITFGYPDHTFKPAMTLTRAHFGIFLARMLEPEFREALTCFEPAAKKTHHVDVAVTTLWTAPNAARLIDKPAVSAPTDIRKWTKTMTIPQKQWLVGKTETQALYGQEVVVLKTSGNWLQVAVKDQYSPKNKSGYPGWVPASHIEESYADYGQCATAMVKAPITNLYHAETTARQFMEISFNTILPVLDEQGDWVKVQTASDGVKYVKKQDVNVLKKGSEIPAPTSEDIMTTAKKFNGLAYLWAGTSGFGLDCSGFTYSVYRQHGIDIPRDASVQATHGTAVKKSELQPGDLLFFAYNKGKGSVHHVGMYIGNGKMIHSPNPKKTVEIISIDAEPYRTEFSGARRYLK
ncbi:NlpC/P60 family protein [Sporosarcina gallistercoris]|uniref:C40 family peptidase n=1 Tax=Sporosarcina gallistercoris TaxID=2762245 RepID=A0ABR8PI10_9BACL|nr:NlpC/P60 family protein [Sporosarcina gallistercoris]MBD7907799.1 C40 family peptidase [Sporosarcina gallistercoris]